MTNLKAIFLGIIFSIVIMAPHFLNLRLINKIITGNEGLLDIIIIQEERIRRLEKE